MFLQNYCKQTSDNAEQGNALNQRRSEDHVCTDVISRFRLTGDGFQRALADVTHTDTGCDSSDTGTDSATGLCQTCRSSFSSLH